jgi:hypothetical protein
MPDVEAAGLRAGRGGCGKRSDTTAAPVRLRATVTDLRSADGATKR